MMEEVKKALTDRHCESLGAEAMITDKPYPGTEVIGELTQADNQATMLGGMQLVCTVFYSLQFSILHQRTSGCAAASLMKLRYSPVLCFRKASSWRHTWHHPAV